MKNPQVLPASEVSPLTGWLGFAGMLIGFLTVNAFSLPANLALLTLIAAAFIPMWIKERTQRASSIPFSSISFASPAQIKYNFASLISAIIIWTPIVGLMRIADGGKVDGFLELFIEWRLELALIFSAWLATHKGDAAAEGGVGNLYLWLKNKKEASLPYLAIRTQAIKAFFLPLMITGANGWLIKLNLGAAGGQGPAWFVQFFVLAYLIDVVFGTIGYTTTSKKVGAEVRSTETSLIGWAAALICYPPFNGWLSASGITAYNDPAYRWYDWLSHSPTLTVAWGSSIIVLTAIYAWATISFGLRFSNLTNRGIITSGPYRFSKHPAYICKNLSWWLIAVPFASTAGPKAAFLSCCSLLLINSFYYARAKTEERHLRHDPRYREYSEWIDQHGAFAALRNSLARFFSILRARQIAKPD